MCGGFLIKREYMTKHSIGQGHSGTGRCPDCNMPLSENRECPNPVCEFTSEKTENSGLSDTNRPMAAVLCGLPGVGKSTVVSKLNQRVGGKILRTDRIRKSMFDEPEYTAEETRMVYNEMFERTGTLLESGDNAILDGTFRRKEMRDRAREKAESHEAAFRLIKVRCNSEVVKNRIENREGLSDADFSVHKRLRKEFEPIEQGEVIDNSGDISAMLKQVAFVAPSVED